MSPRGDAVSDIHLFELICSSLGATFLRFIPLSSRNSLPVDVTYVYKTFIFSLLEKEDKLLPLSVRDA